jgi:uncharacterized membrane protein HdeD (DUF308 family)
MPVAASARGVDGLPGWIRRSWLVPLAVGLVLTVYGAVMLINLGTGLATLRWLVVFALVLAAVEALATAPARRRPWTGWLAGALYAVGALLGTLWPGATLRALAITVGAALLVAGIARVGMAWQAKRTAVGWGWSFVLGLLSAAVGLAFLLGSLIITIVVLVVVLACYVIFSGIALVLLALAVRRLTGVVSRALRR